jgi:hypothetical protein
MTEEKYKEQIQRLAEINNELFRIVMEQSRYIRQMENMEKARRIEKI